MVRLEEATEYDLLFMFNTRNIPEVYAGFYTQSAPLTWKEHFDWWKSRPSSWRSFVVYMDFMVVGVVNIGQLCHWSPEIGYYVHPDHWGKGIGRTAVKQGLGVIRGHGKKYCHTTVLKTNERSIRLLKSLGFKYMAEAREGEIWMTKEL